MSVWTSSIPFERKNVGGGKVHMVQVGEDVWIINEATFGNETIEVFVFNTELQKPCKVDVDFPQSPLFFSDVFVHGDKIFMLMFGNGRSYSLYQLDTKTLKVEYVTMLGELESIAIVGNFMYLLKGTWSSGSIRLTKIDLVGGRKSDPQIWKMKTWQCSFNLKSVGNKLYLLKIDTEENVRTVFKIENEKLEQIHQERFLGNTECFKGRTVSDRFQCFLIFDCKDEDGKSRDKKVCHLDSFDFEECKWNRQTFEWLGNHFSSLLKVNDIVYTIVESMSFDDHIRILERLPSLQKLCILNVINQIIGSGDVSKVDAFEKKLPHPLKKLVSTMLHWRIKKHGYLMSKKRNSVVLPAPDAEMTDEAKKAKTRL